MKKVLFTASILAVASFLLASEGDDLTSLSYISYLERYATVLPANQEESIEAVLNMPLVSGDRIDTAREARMELVLADGNSVWLDEYTTISLDAVAWSRDSESERTVLFIAEGAIAVEVVDHGMAAKPLRIDTRSATTYLIDPGFYRLQCLPSGGLRVEVKAGLAEAATVAGGVLVRAGTSAEVGAGEVLRSEQSLTWSDDFAVWVDARRLISAGESGRHVDLRYSRQAAQLDNYGSWVYVDTLNAWAWQPVVAMDWRPYTAGRWYWTPTGYAWISYEPWGWLPYHYGSWYFSAGFGWVWSWGGSWGPAWVNWVWWPGYVGWCPYGYYNSWYWHHYGGYYPPYNHRPGHPGGGGASQPPRGDVVPPRHASGRVTAGDPTAQRALDLTGQARLSAIDGRAWTVVPEENFTSPSLTRYARAGDRVLPSAGEERAVILSGPLATRSPAAASQPDGIESVFRRIGATTSRDVSPLLARDSSLAPEAVRSIGARTTVSDLSRRGLPPQQTLSGTSTQPRLSTSGTSRFTPATSGDRSRLAVPNIHRPLSSAVTPGAATSVRRSPLTPSAIGSSAGSLSGSSTLVAPRSSTGRVGISRPVIVPRTGSAITARPPSGSVSSATGIRRPSTSSVPRVSAPSTRSSSGRVSAPRASSGSRSSGGAASRARPSTPSSRPSGGSSGAKKR